MTTLELLHETASALAWQLNTANESQLRRVAGAVSRAAVERTSLSHPLIAEALTHLSTSASPDTQLRGRVQEFAAQLDEQYFQLKQAHEEAEDAGKTNPQVVLAFSRARAASAVAAALDNDARTAAAVAAYEAIAATGDSIYLTAVTESVLATPTNV